MTNDLYSADKVNELEKKVAMLKKVIDQLVTQLAAREINKQREQAKRSIITE